MATLLELNDLLSDSDLQNKIRGALLKTQVSVAFEAVNTPNHTARLAFSETIMNDVNGVATKVQKYVIGANAALSSAAILALTDAEIQSHVDASLAILAVD